MSKRTKHIVITQEAESQARFIASATADRFVGTAVERLVKAEYKRIVGKVATRGGEELEADDVI